MKHFVPIFPVEKSFKREDRKGREAKAGKPSPQLRDGTTNGCRSVIDCSSDAGMAVPFMLARWEAFGVNAKTSPTYIGSFGWREVEVRRNKPLLRSKLPPSGGYVGNTMTDGVRSVKRVLFVCFLIKESDFRDSRDSRNKQGRKGLAGVTLGGTVIGGG
jgi:hypothetical protein